MSKKTTDPVRVLYWLKTSRGTDVKKVFDFPAGTGKEEIVDHHGQWADRVMPPAADFARHGWIKIRFRPRRAVSKDYDKACVAKAKANDRWSRLAEELNPTKVT